MFVKSDTIRRLALLLPLLLAFGLAAGCSSAGVAGGQAGKADPQQVKSVEQLNRLADDMYKLAMAGQVEQARGKLLQLGDEITQIRFDGMTSVEGMNALTESVTQAKRVFNAVRFSPEAGQVAVAKIRLATDALTHDNQPMWLQYYKVLQNDIGALDQAVKAGKQPAAWSGYETLSQHVSVIHPALLISRSPSDVEKLDSLLTALRGGLRAEPLPQAQLEDGIEHLQRTVDELFMKKAEATAYLPMTDPKQPIIWSLGIGLIIVSVLSYAGWRMFRSGRSSVPVKIHREG
ncbi:sporulation protein [Paenibacillus athensensis]|uniref:Sporulation protein YpjB n=1 Tax=Paenibacillus athensensis TaxID=1967502 RepID=A0A4Y8Q992_9BACL|nr:sporulation protein YpjB [Paenibacillus athensensis]MCD1260254.1 sporulation protein [Paenibacillus athensensis]